MRAVPKPLRLAKISRQELRCSHEQCRMLDEREGDEPTPAASPPSCRMLDKMLSGRRPTPPRTGSVRRSEGPLLARLLTELAPDKPPHRRVPSQSALAKAGRSGSTALATDHATTPGFERLANLPPSRRKPRESKYACRRS